MFAYIRSFFVSPVVVPKKPVLVKPKVCYKGKITLVTGSTNEKISLFMKDVPIDILLTDMVVFQSFDASTKIIQWDSDAIFDICPVADKYILVNTLDMSKLNSSEFIELVEKTRKASATLIVQCPLEKAPSSVVKMMDQVVFCTPARGISLSERTRFQRALFSSKTTFDTFMKDWGRVLRDDGFYLVKTDTTANK